MIELAALLTDVVDRNQVGIAHRPRLEAIARLAARVSTETQNALSIIREAERDRLRRSLPPVDVP